MLKNKMHVRKFLLAFTKYDLFHAIVDFTPEFLNMCVALVKSH